MISQPAPAVIEKSPFYEIIQKYNAKIDYRPFIKVVGVSLKEFRSQRVEILEHTAVVFTNRTTVDSFFRICEEARITVPETMKYFCNTEAIALYLQKYIVYRKRKIFHGNNGKLDDMLPSLIKHKKEKFLFAVSDVHKEDTSILDKNGIDYTKAVMYRTVSNDFRPDEKFDYDMLLFFSPSGIDSLMKNFPDFQQNDIRIGCFGATTAQAVRNAGLRLDMEAPTVKAPSMTAALDNYLKEDSAIALSSDFRGALAENSVMQAFSGNGLQTYYWMPPSSWKTNGELDFLLQTDRMEIVPVEVKSARNVRARTLGSFMEKARSPYAYILSENNFARSETDDGRKLRHLPLYAAGFIGANCLKGSL